MFLFPLTPRKIEKWASQKKFDKVLQALSMDDKPVLQAAAINALSKMEGRFLNLAPRLIELYNKPELRKPLIVLFGKYHEQEILDKLLELLKNDQENRPEIIKSLGSLGYPEAVPALLATSTNQQEQKLIVTAIKEIIRISSDYHIVLNEFSPDKPVHVLLALCQIFDKMDEPDIHEKLTEFVFNPNHQLRSAVGKILEKDPKCNWAKYILGKEDDFKRLAEIGNYYYFQLLMEQYEKGNKILDLYPEPIVSFYTSNKGINRLDDFLRFVQKNKSETALPALKKNIWNNDGKLRLKIAEVISSMGIADFEGIIKGNPGDYIRMFKNNPEEGGAIIRKLIDTIGKNGEEIKIMKTVIGDLAKSKDPKAVEILFYGTSKGFYEEECFEALPPTNNEKIVSSIMQMLVSYDGKQRLKAAKKLDQMGDHRWIDQVRGDDYDTERLCMAGNPAALNHVIMTMGVLKKEYRAEAANLLLRVFREHPEYPLKWSDVIDQIKRPHEDSHADDHSDSDRSSDCHMDEGESVHTDTGVGIYISEEDIRRFSRIDYLELRKNQIITEKSLIQQFNENEPIVFEEMFEDALQYSSQEMIETMGRFSEKSHPLAPKAVEHLLKQGDSALPFLASSLLRNKDSKVVDKLVSTDKNKVYNLLVDLLKKDGKIENVVEVLGLIGDNRACVEIKPLLTHPNGNIRLQAANTLAKLGEPEWQQFIKNESEDFERLIKKSDPQLLSWYIENFKSNDNQHLKVRLAQTLTRLGEKELAAEVRKMLISPCFSRNEVAKAMALVDGKTKWDKIIRGDENDFMRIADTLCWEAVKILMVFLGAPDRKIRMQAAEALFKVAKADFSLVQQDWKTLSDSIREKHEDNNKHTDHWGTTHSGDCHSDSTVHTDAGIGMTIPEEIG